MAIAILASITLSVQDMANILGVTVANVAGSITTSQTNVALTNALYTGAASPFFGMPLLYTSGATIGAGDNITISLATGARSSANARRLIYTVNRVQNFQSSGFLPNSAPGGRIDQTF